ncbi:MAG TPA: alanine--tRNA ligase [Bacteroidales bacterium]|nr:alanine--tRNA ligase [Bacteroidales bacterium]
MTSADIRQTFLDFFASKQHTIVPSAPMVIKNDPTLMFTNAGMNQFKDIFLGTAPLKYPRIADTQKCLRVSGKHNDLEEVGHDTYHHTMFEMLGNWSFGDYFKKEAIAWAWELLTVVLKIDPSRLYVTVFGGDKNDNLPVDQEAFDIWKQWIAEDRILHGSKKDNFWEMGDTGPCGPCSEIHVDIRNDDERAKVPGHTLINKDHPLVIEIWNNVFIQFNRMANGSLVPLPAKHVDTGMGFERLCMVLQGKQSNYDTDIFTPIIGEISKLSGIPYGASPKSDIAMRVIADHLRAVAFAIADGQLPSNVKAGYVIRRILRRAVRYAYSFLNVRDPFIFKLLPVLEKQMGGQFPELVKQSELIHRVMHEEENSFLRTLSIGIQKFQQYTQSQETTKTIAGDFAFELYDTYGFPIDLTQLMSRELGWTVDMDGFQVRLEEQKNRSRKDAAIEAEDWIELIPSTGSEFVGYDFAEINVNITSYRKMIVKGREVYQLVFDKTPFYAESGGQTGDTGYIESAGERIMITDTRKEHGLSVHLADKLPSNPSAVFMAVVDVHKRTLTANNHSATHLLHHALREILGSHVEQKGSFVGPEYLRFDFSHFQKLTDEETARVEKMVNQKIRLNNPLDEHRSVPMEKAKEMGALAFFGEKYGDSVRVVRFGESIELCGGTHVKATGQIGLFKIVSESAIAAGVRRIEAITADKAEEYFNEQLAIVDQLKALVRNPNDPLRAVQQLIDQQSELKKQLESLNAEKSGKLKDELAAKAEPVNGLNFIATRVDLDAQAIKDLAFALKAMVENLFLVLGNESDGKAGLTVMISDNLVAERQLNAGQIVRELAKNIQGGGGGQPNYATAGGKNPDGLSAAFEQAKKLIS